MHPHLAADGVVGRCRVGHVIKDARAAQRWRCEHTGEQGAHNAAHAVHAKHVQRVVGTEHALQATHAPQADQASDQADDDGTHGADKTASRGHGHQASHCARGRAQHRCLAFGQGFTGNPAQGGGRCGDQGVDKGQGGHAIGFQVGASVEAKPTHPQQGSTHHGQGQAVRGHGFFAVTHALAQHVRADQASHTGVDVHHGAAGEVQRALGPQPAGSGGDGLQGFLVGDGVGAVPIPNHVGDRQVAEGEPQGTEQQHRRELDALGKRAHDQAAGDGSKRGLEGNKRQLRDDHAFAEGGGHRVRRDAFEEQLVEPANEWVAPRECSGVAVQHPQDVNHGCDDKHLHQHRQHVFRAHQAAVEQGQAGDGHEDHQQGGHGHPGRVAFVGHGRSCGGCGFSSRRCFSGCGGRSSRRSCRGSRLGQGR